MIKLIDDKKATILLLNSKEQCSKHLLFKIP